MLQHAERLRLRVAFTAVALALVLGAGGVLSWWLLDAVDLSHQEMVYGSSQDLADLDVLAVALQERSANARGYLLSGDPSFLDARNRAAERFESRLAVMLKRHPDDEKGAALKSIAALELRFSGVSERAMQARSTNRDASLDLWIREVRPLHADLAERLDEIVIAERTRFEASRSHALESTIRGRRALGGLAAMMVLALAFLFYQLATTARELMHQVADEQQQTLFRLLEQLPVGILVLDHEGKPFFANQYTRGLLGRAFDARSPIGSIASVIAAYEAGTDRPYPLDRTPLARALQGERTEVSDMEVRRNGDVVPLHVSGAPIYAGDGSLAFAVAAFQDIRELQRAATRDPLTGLGNRTSLAHAFVRERMLQERAGTALALAMIDLDHFKRVNDAHGHLTGDLVLRRTAETLVETLRRTDIVVRWGGEELVAVMPGADRQGAHAALEKAREAVKAIEYAGADGTRFHVTFSAGLVIVRPQEPLESAVARADELLYQAKSEGRDRVVVAVQSERAVTA